MHTVLSARRIHSDARKAAQARIAAAIADARRAVLTGACPQCGTALRRNLALAGWWQCGAHGEPSFRKPEHRDLPACSFQCFTE
jgi:hypothetical protein